MAYLDSADCAQRVKTRLNRPSTDAAFTRDSADDVLYELGTEAQSRVTDLLGVYVPDAVWTVPTALTSSDGGYTYGFGDDTDGDAIFAFGQFQVYEARSHIPETPLTPGVDFTVEGSVLRIPGNVTRAFADSGPWVQYAAPSNVLSATTQPTIPKFARLAMVEEWAARCAKRLKLDASEHEAAFDAAWLELLAKVRTQAAGKGGPTLTRRSRTWASRYGR